MSQVRRYFRGIGQQVRAELSADVENVRMARLVGQPLQSFNAALGVDIHDLRKGAVRFGNRWYFPATEAQSLALEKGHASIAALQAAVRARISDRIAAHTSVTIETDDQPRPAGRIRI